jgi:DNA-binding NtrC family response regulator
MASDRHKWVPSEADHTSLCAKCGEDVHADIHRHVAQPKPLRDRLRAAEAEIIMAELDAQDGSIRATAAALGISEPELLYRVRLLGASKEPGR